MARNSGSMISSMITASSIKGVIDAINKMEQAIRDILTTTKVENELPAGSINGSNMAFTLTKSPDPSGSLQMFLDGMFMTVGEDYIISGLNITFLLSPPQTGSILRAFFRY